MMSTESANELKRLAGDLESYLDSKGFQNTSLDGIYLPQASPTTSLTRDMSRLIISAEVPMLPKSFTQGFGDVNSSPGFSFGMPLPTGSSIFPPAAKTNSDGDKFQKLNEFESRLFYAITIHAVVPLLQSLCDVGDLARRMQDYVSSHPKVTASTTHIFCDNTGDKRMKYVRLVKHLTKAAAALKSIPSCV
ncbi:unnamed protein product [Phytophthora fragariaefolia]|uniref:Unnamed protein product n=1 Tax=Phytophthora fragariaefolia TaxID=1490495 RepID=A0A9W6XLF9_9STRA|nr:unnamed protein product [Phytophthora fragariaefolia]